jgi:hypothetical protein
MMLQTYKAQLEGSQLIWVDPPPALAQRHEVIVVIDSNALNVVAENAPSDAYSLFDQLSGALGHVSRADVDAQLTAMRAEWDRPLGV